MSYIRRPQPEPLPKTVDLQHDPRGEKRRLLFDGLERILFRLKHSRK